LRVAANRIKLNGLTHFISDDGDEAAPAAILLHGFPDTSSVWRKVTPLLAAGGFRVIAPDGRFRAGTGIQFATSTRPSRRFRVPGDYPSASTGIAQISI
jgi:pimeloyl-ACP methyl ester carboxylesterase